MAGDKLIGKWVKIKGTYGDYGKVIFFDGDYYHVAMFGDENFAPIFAREEIAVMRNQEFYNNMGKGA